MKIVCVKAKKACTATLVALLLFCMAFFVCAAGSYGVFALTKKRLLPIYSVERSDQKIAISFDCAWGTEHTDDILDELDKANVKCTFFAVEFWVEKYPTFAKKIIERGHELGTHSKTHPHMAKMSKSQILEELRSSSKKIEDTVGIYPTLFRPPFGEYTDSVISSAEETGLFSIQWDVDSLDWKDLSAQAIATRVIPKVSSGSIILCHNNGLHTAEALPLIFSALQTKGFTFVPIGELIYKENYTINSSGRQVQKTA